MVQRCAMFTGSEMRHLVIVVSFLMLSGCGIVARNDARIEYQGSAANYKACLVSNPAAPQNCEGLRLAMETDERKFNNVSAVPGAQRSDTVTILNR
jgi:hypothetical protein